MLNVRLKHKILEKMQRRTGSLLFAKNREKLWNLLENSGSLDNGEKKLFCIKRGFLFF